MINAKLKLSNKYELDMFIKFWLTIFFVVYRNMVMLPGNMC